MNRTVLVLEAQLYIRPWPDEALWGSPLSENEAVVTTGEIQAIAKKLKDGLMGISNIAFKKAVEEFSEVFKVVFQG